jgi:DNA-binding Lrp family transcriptional regulator
MPNTEIGSKGEQMEISGLDEADKRILELLREKARMSCSEIGKAVG